MIELKALQGQVKHLVDDLRMQVKAPGELQARLRQEYAPARSAERTGATFEAWAEDALDQAAVAWVLSCVFVRFCEDNRLVEPVWIGGSDEHAPAGRGVQARQAYLIANPLHNDRHWLREAFTHLQGLRATEKIFDKQHNPVWHFDISGDVAEALVDFFRHRAGAVSLRMPTLDIRFLGDLYQELSQHAKKAYALLQTPVFVEEFILDRTLEPAVAEFGLANSSLIDPACGSGHFLLGAFDRLVKKWVQREPGEDVRVLAERALGQVTGVDVNPFAVAITRFRLLVAMLKVCGYSTLERLPNFPVRVATGDSLLQWGETSSHQGDLVALAEGRPEFAYYTEDGDLLTEYLKQGQYTVVVGNPPYITVKDKVLNERYRRDYSACSGKYAMTVPFAQLFFTLAKQGDHDGDGSGWVGQITANSFMKREFGRKLINEFFAHHVELSEVIDTSGAYIPGHGTPTVILVGRNRLISPRYSGPIRTILGVRGEPSQPEDPSRGLVWTAIVEQIDRPGSESEWISSADFAREQLAAHPWSLSGGGASGLMSMLHEADAPLRSVAHRLGVFGMTNADDVMLATKRDWVRRAGDASLIRRLVVGDEIRDWSLSDGAWSFFPYDSQLSLVDLPEGGHARWLWPARTVMGNRATFGKETYFAEGRPWYEWHQVTGDPGGHEWWIAFAFVATHNHFVLDRSGKVFKQSAPVIKLPEGASEDDHLRLLGVLNSSTACFWLKQVSQPKAGGGVGRGMQDEMWEERYEFTATKLQEFPLPESYPLELSRDMDEMAQQLGAVAPASIVASGTPTPGGLALAREEWHSGRARMIALQEELDWRVYRLFGLVEDDSLTVSSPPTLALGERAFEIVLARQMEAGDVHTQWFARHGSKPITELPKHWPEDYRSIVERRIAIIESDRNIALIERPECKRRWSLKRDKEAWGWAEQQTAALRDWLLDRLESPELWGGNPTLLSVAQLADRVRHDDDFRSVLDLWVGTDQHDLAKSLAKLVADEHVPFLPASRYTPNGLRKRAQWERTWALQRREDAGEKVEIAVPPKYTSADFARNSFWRNRGKLDVPKERFISYPRVGRDADSTELLGWAGWDNLDQARALAAAYLDRKTQAGWPAERLLPILAGLAELEPWLHQWHTEARPGYPGTPADFFTGLIDTDLSHLSADRAALAEVRGVEELA